MNIYNVIHGIVEEENLTMDDFKQLATYLLEKGVIAREDSLLEESLYDKYVRVQNVIEDYFAVIDVQVYHDERTSTIRLFAPASRTPDNINGEDVNRSLAMKLGSEESAYLLALAIIYDQKLREGNILDDASVEIDLDVFNTTLASNLGFTPTESKKDRKDALSTLRKLKAVQFTDGVFEDEDKPLIIRHHIKDLVLDNMISPYIEEYKDED